MKLKPTCVVFQHRVYNSNTINFNTTSIENYIQKNVFSIKPNPVQNQLTIENTKKANLQQIQFWDINGRLVKERRFESETIEVSDLKKGLYILRLIGENGTEELKLVKE